MQKTVIGLGVISVVLAGGWFLVSGGQSESAMKAAEMMKQKEMEEKAMMEKAAMEEKAISDKSAIGKSGDSMETEAEMMKKDETIPEAEMEDKDMMKKDDMSAAGAGEVMQKAGIYTMYDASKLAMANTGDVVLFFKASWCPSCRAVDADIKANLGTIPPSLTIMEVDYDTSTALKQKYGVTTQHTFVQVDAAGTLITKWSGGSTLASVVAKVQ
jgi:thioredoxin 1